MLTLSSLRNDVVQCRISGAMRKAVNMSRLDSNAKGYATVKNKKGEQIIKVCHFRSNSKAFQFINLQNGKNITDTVIASLREGQIVEETPSIPKAVFIADNAKDTFWNQKAIKSDVWKNHYFF